MSLMISRMQTAPLVATTDRHYTDRGVFAYHSTPSWVNQASTTVVRVRAGKYLAIGYGNLLSIGSETDRVPVINGLAAHVLTVSEGESLYVGRDSTVSGIGTFVVWRI